MLVGRGVEHHLRAELAEHVVQSRLLPHVSDHRDEVKVLVAFLELEAEVVHRGLAVVEQHELLRAERGELAAELRADRAGRSGHHHGLPAEVLDDRVHVEPDLVAAQKVLDLDLADGRLHDLAVDDLVDARRHEHLHLALLAVVHETLGLGLDRLFAGEEDGVHEETLAEEGDVGRALEVEYLDAADVLAAEPGAVVKVADHVVVRRAGKAGHGGDGLVVDTVHHHVLALPRRHDLLAQGIIGDDHSHAHHQQEDDSQAAVQRADHGVVGVSERKRAHHHAHGQRLQERSHADLGELLEGGVAHDRAVGPQREEEDKRQDQRQATPRHGEAAGQGILGKEEADEDQGADRCGKRHQKVYRKDQLRAEETVQMEPGYESLYIVHRISHNQSVTLPYRTSTKNPQWGTLRILKQGYGYWKGTPRIVFS